MFVEHSSPEKLAAIFWAAIAIGLVVMVAVSIYDSK